MQVWRLCRAPHVSSTLEGIGARRVGGRWNHLGHPMVYTSSSLALAALELLVHVSRTTAPDDLRCLRLDVPDDGIERLDPASLPPDWQQYPFPTSTQAIGTAWLESKRSLALVVPSVVVPLEHNLLINPDHPDIGRVRVDEDEPFSLDSRLLVPRSPR